MWASCAAILQGFQKKSSSWRRTLPSRNSPAGQYGWWWWCWDYHAPRRSRHVCVCATCWPQYLFPSNLREPRLCIGADAAVGSSGLGSPKVAQPCFRVHMHIMFWRTWWVIHFRNLGNGFNGWTGIKSITQNQRHAHIHWMCVCAGKSSKWSAIVIQNLLIPTKSRSNVVLLCVSIWVFRSITKQSFESYFIMQSFYQDLFRCCFYKPWRARCDGDPCVWSPGLTAENPGTMGFLLPQISEFIILVPSGASWDSRNFRWWEGPITVRTVHMIEFC